MGISVRVEDMEPGDGYDVGDINLRATLPFDPQNPPDHLFVSPTEAAPYWWLALRLPDWKGGPNASIASVTIDGRPQTDYYILVNGEVRHEPWITRRAESASKIAVAIKMLWANGQAYDVAVQIKNDDNRATHHVAFTAPSGGGGPPGFHCYDSFKLRETAGILRMVEPVEIVVAAERWQTPDLAGEVRLYRYDVNGGVLTPWPCQVFEPRTFSGIPAVPQGSEPKGRGRYTTPSQTVRLAFLALTVPPHSSQIYCAAYGGTPPHTRPALTNELVVSTSADGGTVVENGYYRVDLHPQSGQINSFIMTDPAESCFFLDSLVMPVGQAFQRSIQRRGKKIPPFTNSTSDAVHWNPDTFGDNGRWGHAFSWDPPERTHVSADGPILYRITRSGRMPGWNPEVELSVTYSFWAGVPYIRMSSSMRVTDDYGSLAVRNGEMVFDADLFDAFAWKEKSGQIRKIRALHRPDPLIDAPATPAADIPWVALYNTRGRYALGAIALTAHAYDPINGNPSIYRPAYFLYTHPFWARPLNYFVRAWVYPWGYNDRGPVIPVSRGSTYVEDMAFLPFLLDETDPFRPIEMVDRVLRAPLEIEYGH